MKRRFLYTFFLGASMTLGGSGALALDIQTTAGTTYPDVQLSGVSDEGVQFTTLNGTFMTVPCSSLTPASYRIVMNLAPEGPATVGGILIRNIRNSYQMILRMEKNIAKQYPNPTANPFGVNTAPAIPLLLPSIPSSNVQFSSITPFGSGTVGWAGTDPGDPDNVSYGRIFIYGLNLQQDSSWSGNLYPTNQTITFYNWVVPVFATTAQAAILLGSE